MEAPTSGPASRIRGVRPRSSRCAAAASPTGPAPMTTTGRCCASVRGGVVVEKASTMGVFLNRSVWTAPRGRAAAR
ncbi:hypothetical protein ACFFX0_27670 [Citricoccus parietis]|uniref:Uncharacterized protein n=1 Tax=Citricoccus parietis TaxID=592307 RepID=A0ABV5G835_9MICC